MAWVFSEIKIKHKTYYKYNSKGEKDYLWISHEQKRMFINSTSDFLQENKFINLKIN